MKTALALVATILLTSSAPAANYGQGEVATYVPIPTYGQVKADWNDCYWNVDLSAKQTGGRKIEIGSLKVPSPYLCTWASGSGNIKNYLLKEAKYLDSFISTVADSLSGKVGASTLVYSFHFNEKGQNWYYTGTFFSGKLLSYGWQKVPDKNYAYYYYNSTSGKISDQAPKPTDRPDALPVLNSTDSSKLARKANYLNSRIKGGYEEEVYKNGVKISDEFHALGGKYDIFAETYTDQECSGKNITYRALDHGKGITAFEKDIVIPDLQRRGLTSGVVAFFYSPTIYSLEDEVVVRKLTVSCPSGYSYNCVKDTCTRGSATARPSYYLYEEHEITAHLSRDVRVDLITADGKSSLLETTTIRLPDYKYRIKLKAKIPASTFREAVNYAKGKSLSIEDCSYGKFVAYSGNTPLSVPRCVAPPPPPVVDSLPPSSPPQKVKKKTHGSSGYEIPYKKFIRLYAVARYWVGTVRDRKGTTYYVFFTVKDSKNYTYGNLITKNWRDAYKLIRKSDKALIANWIRNTPTVKIYNPDYCLISSDYKGQNYYCKSEARGVYVVKKQDFIRWCRTNHLSCFIDSKKISSGSSDEDFTITIEGKKYEVFFISAIVKRVLDSPVFATSITPKPSQEKLSKIYSKIADIHAKAVRSFKNCKGKVYANNVFFPEKTCVSNNEEFYRKYIATPHSRYPFIVVLSSYGDTSYPIQFIILKKK